MARFEVYQEENEQVRERFELAGERLHEIVDAYTQSAQGEGSIGESLNAFFCEWTSYLQELCDTFSLLENGEYEKLSEEELARRNQRIYHAVLPEYYETSFINPAYAVAQVGEELGKILSAVAMELHRTKVYVFRGCLSMVTIRLELLLELYHMAEDEVPVQEWKDVWYSFHHDYLEENRLEAYRHSFLASYSWERKLIEQADLTDLRYLYLYGEYISDNERQIATFLNSLSEEQIEAMAFTYTNGYKKGFEAYKIDLSKKALVQLRIPVGFERMVRAAIRQFREMGLESVIDAGSTSPNRQADFDHKQDLAVILDKPYADAFRDAEKKAFEALKKEAGLYAGPAVIETFGETPFEPVKKPEAPAYSEKQQEVFVWMNSERNILRDEYIPSDEVSFTIIAYPIPEIGDQFEEIFAETVRVNTLDSDRYRQIQQNLIDALDEGEYVRVLGAGENRTDLTIQLHTLTDPSKQTNFENCLDDVNIPVGEVFTSPILTGTSGVLHVTEVYLRGLRYLNLALTFEDGRISEYHCSNFDSEEQNRKFIQENLLQNHKTLPIGEFAIGTNTTAYVMGRKYDIQGKLPILIAEKTGPHFAVGDTCYSMSEDHVVYNPDGKEIIARDNECSILRKTDRSKAYFNCHTDITIPYHELKEITVYRADGTSICLIQDGRFVLPGTEELNCALDEYEKNI